MDKDNKSVELLVLPTEEEMEIYNTKPGYPNSSYSSMLKPNRVGDETTVYSFGVPTGYFARTNPDSKFDGVLFRPYDNKGNFIDGLINVYSMSGLQGFRTRIYSGSTEFHNPKTPASLIRDNRKWTMKHILGPGDNIEVCLIADKVMNVSKSSVSLTFRAGHYMVAKVKLCESCEKIIREARNEL